MLSKNVSLQVVTLNYNLNVINQCLSMPPVRQETLKADQKWSCFLGSCGIARWSIGPC